MHPSLLLVGLLLALCTSLKIDKNSPAVVFKVIETEAEVRAYWTPERLKAAIPYKVSPEFNSSSKMEEGNCPPDGSATSYPGSSALMNMTQKMINSTGSFPTPVAVNPATFPYSLTGQVSFVEGGQNFVCSASQIGPSTVLTAGHCVYSAANGFNTMWAYRPLWPAETPVYAAIQLIATTDWVASGATDFSADYAAATFATNSFTQWTGRVFNQVIDSSTHYTAVGYPAAPPYDGSQKYEVYGAAQVPQTQPQPSPGTVEMENSMTGGSSGGPWWYKWKDGDTVMPHANGVNSFGFDSLSTQYTYSPCFLSDADYFLQYAIAVS